MRRRPTGPGPKTYYLCDDIPAGGLAYVLVRWHDVGEERILAAFATRYLAWRNLRERGVTFEAEIAYVADEETEGRLTRWGMRLVRGKAAA